MGALVTHTRVACNTATGTQDITTTKLGGLIPKAAIFFVTKASSNGTPVDDDYHSTGVAVSATQRWAINGCSAHNQDTSMTYADAALQGGTGVVYLMLPDGSFTMEGFADFSSWITNGVRINWTTAPSAAYLLTVVFFAGTDVTAYANRFQVGDAVDVERDCTDPNMSVDLLFVAGDRTTSGQTANSRSIFGFVYNTGTGVEQRSMAEYQVNNQASSNVNIQAESSYGHTTPNNDWKGEFGNFDSQGFSVWERINGGNNQYIYYLALNFNGAVSCKVGDFTTAASTGNASFTGLSWKPQFLMLIGTFFTSGLPNFSGSNPTSLTYCLSMIDGTDQYCTSTSEEDNVDTTNVQNLSEDKAIQLPYPNGSAGITASLVSLNSDGWTFNYTSIGEGASNFLYLAIEEEATAYYALRPDGDL